MRKPAHVIDTTRKGADTVYSVSGAGWKRLNVRADYGGRLITVRMHSKRHQGTARIALLSTESGDRGNTRKNVLRLIDGAAGSLQFRGGWNALVEDAIEVGVRRDRVRALQSALNTLRDENLPVSDDLIDRLRTQHRVLRLVSNAHWTRIASIQAAAGITCDDRPPVARRVRAMMGG